jgi:outer membrane autotransporter protein
MKNTNNQSTYSLSKNKQSFILKKISALTMLITIPSQVFAHTSSIGYENSGPGSVTFWYGTYHGGTSFTEGSLRVVGPSSYDSTVPFTLLVSAKPTGLVDGVNNFYSNGTTLVGPGQGGAFENGSQTWQGSTFANLTPGTYTFTYIPIANPTQEWDPIDFVILSSSVVLDASVLGGGLFEPNSSNNSNNAAKVLDSLVGNSSTEMSNALADLVLMSDEAQSKALEKIAPNTSQASARASSQTVTGALDTIQIRLDTLRSDSFNYTLADDLKSGKVVVASTEDLGSLFVDESKRNSFWSKAFFSNGNQDNRSGFAGFNAKSAGVAFGADTLLANDWLLGAALTYASTNVDMKAFRSGDRTDIDTYQLTAYATRNFGEWYLESMVAYARQEYDAKRDTAVTGIARGDYSGDHYAARVNVGYPIQLHENTKVTPIVGLEVSKLDQHGYTEKDAGPLSMKVESQSSERIRSLVGLKITSEFQIGHDFSLTPAVHSYWRHDFNNDGFDTTSTFTGGGASFKTLGQKIARDTYNIGASLMVNTKHNFSVSVQLDAEQSSGYDAIAGQVVANWKF